MGTDEHGFFTIAARRFQGVPPWLPLLQGPGSSLYGLAMRESSTCLCNTPRARRRRSPGATHRNRTISLSVYNSKHDYPLSTPLSIIHASQDLDYDAAVPLYINRKYFVEFFDTRVYQKGHTNIPEDFIYVTFHSMQYVAMVRANALVDILISRPFWKSAQLVNWSPRSMGEVHGIAERFFIRDQHDGNLFLDPQLDLFNAIADQKPLFAQWRRYTFECDTVSSPSGSAKHLVWKCALVALLNPHDATNMRTRMKTVEYLEVQSAAALRKLHDPKQACCLARAAYEPRWREGCR